MNKKVEEPLVMSSFTPITIEEAAKSIELSYEMVKATNKTVITLHPRDYQKLVKELKELQ